MEFDFKSYNARVDERQSFQPGTPEFAERVRRECLDAKNHTPRSFLPRGIGHYKPCAACGGSGKIDTGWFFTSLKPCPECNGEGTVWVALLP